MPDASGTLTALPASRRWWSLIAIAAGVLVIGLDQTVLNLALPALSRSLHSSSSDLQWFSDAYTLVIAAVILPAGMFGDRMGRKKILLISLVLFGLSSAACAYAHSSGELIAFRAILGLGAAAILPMSLSLLPVLFTPEERPRAIAVIMGATFIAYPVGPLLGGLAAGQVLVGVGVPHQRPGGGAGPAGGGHVDAGVQERPSSPDGPGGHRAVQPGAGRPHLRVHRSRGEELERHHRHRDHAGRCGRAGWVRRCGSSGSAACSPPPRRGPMAPGPASRWSTSSCSARPASPGGRSSPPWSPSRSSGSCSPCPSTSRRSGAWTPWAAGVRLLPMIGGLVVGMLVGTHLQGAPKGQPRGTSRANIKTLVTVGFVIMAVGLVIGAFTRTTSGTGFVAAWFAVAGVGLGLSMPTASNAALGASTPERSGSGSAVISACRQVGATIGVAILGTVLNSGYRSQLDLHGLTAAVAGTVRSSVTGGIEVAQATHSTALLQVVRSAFAHGLDLMMWVCAAIALVCGVLALLFLPRRAAVPAGASAASVEPVGETGPGHLDEEVGVATAIPL